MRINILLIIICLISANIFALTLEEAIEIGLVNSPIIHSAKEALNQARYDYQQSNFELLPTASIIGGYSMYQPDLANTASNNLAYGLQANMPLFTGGKVWQNSRIKRNNYLVAQNEFQNQRMSLINDIENKFFNVQEAILGLQIAQSDYDNALVYEEITDVRHAQGAISQADYFRIKADVQQKMVRFIINQSSYFTALQDLRLILNISEEIEIDEIEGTSLDEAQPTNPFPMDVNELQNLVNRLVIFGIENNLSLKNNELNLENLKKNVTTAAGNFMPSISLSYRKEWQKYDIQDNFTDSGTISLNASIPIFPVGNNTANYLKNRASFRKAEFDQDTAENTLNLNIRTAAISWISATQSEISARYSLEYAENAYQQTLERYRQGVVSSMELLDSDIIYSNARYQYINTQFNILRSKANLKYLLNIEDEEELFNFIQ